MCFTVVTGYWYLGGFIGEDSEKEKWIKDEVEAWVELVELLSSAAKKYCQTAYATMQKSLQQRWQYVQCVCPNIGDSNRDGNMYNMSAPISETSLMD
jgi:hypothetical protein